MRRKDVRPYNRKSFGFPGIAILSACWSFFRWVRSSFSPFTTTAMLCYTLPQTCGNVYMRVTLTAATDLDSEVIAEHISLPGSQAANSYPHQTQEETLSALKSYIHHGNPVHTRDGGVSKVHVAFYRCAGLVILARSRITTTRKMQPRGYDSF
jgi:hypothetical protein